MTHITSRSFNSSSLGLQNPMLSWFSSFSDPFSGSLAWFSLSFLLWDMKVGQPPFYIGSPLWGSYPICSFTGLLCANDLNSDPFHWALGTTSPLDIYLIKLLTRTFLLELPPHLGKYQHNSLTFSSIFLILYYLLFSGFLGSKYRENLGTFHHPFCYHSSPSNTGWLFQTQIFTFSLSSISSHHTSFHRGYTLASFRDPTSL